MEIRLMGYDGSTSSGTGIVARLGASPTSATEITVTGIVNVPANNYIDCLVDAKSMETDVTATGYVIGRRIG